MGKKAEIIELANRLLQERGVGSLSFRELAKSLGIKSSSVHYYFPQKDDLIDAIAEQYSEGMFALLAQRTEDIKGGKEKLNALIDMIHEHIEDRLCTAGILAAESAYISEQTRDRVEKFFGSLFSWVEACLTEMGKGENEANMLAGVILTAIEGSLMIDSIRGESYYLERLKDFIATL